jgi:hypothetical protein
VLNIPIRHTSSKTVRLFCMALPGFQPMQRISQSVVPPSIPGFFIPANCCRIPNSSLLGWRAEPHQLFIHYIIMSETFSLAQSVLYRSCAAA